MDASFGVDPGRWEEYLSFHLKQGSERVADNLTLGLTSVRLQATLIE